MKFKLGFISVVLFFIVLLYVAAFGFFKETDPVLESGCVIKRNLKGGYKPLIFIKVENKVLRFSENNKNLAPKGALLGKCVYFEYYTDSYGRKIVTKFFKDNEL